MSDWNLELPTVKAVKRGIIAQRERVVSALRLRQKAPRVWAVTITFEYLWAGRKWNQTRWYGTERAAKQAYRSAMLKGFTVKIERHDTPRNP